MESIGASERVMEYLDRDIAPQLSQGRILPHFRGKVGHSCRIPPYTSTCVLSACFRHSWELISHCHSKEGVFNAAQQAEGGFQ